MSKKEMESPIGPVVFQAMVEASASKRIGTPDDIASAAEYFLGPKSSFVTGSDLLIDGGVIAAMRTGRLSLPG